MKKSYKNQLTVLFVGLALATNSQADLLGYDLNTNQLPSLQRFVGHHNNSIDLFASAQDGAQVYHYRGDNFQEIPEGLVDASASGFLDNIGLIMPTSDFEFFGVIDTLNASNPEGVIEATWDFEILEMTDITVAIDFAAMGDFETSDEYQVNYAIDYGEFFPLFEFNTETALSMNYHMENGNPKTLADPLSVSARDSTIRYTLDNNFDTFTTSIPNEGSNLTIQLVAKADGGTEAFGMTDIRVFGEPSPFPMFDDDMLGPQPDPADDLGQYEDPSFNDFPADIDLGSGEANPDPVNNDDAYMNDIPGLDPVLDIEETTPVSGDSGNSQNGVGPVANQVPEPSGFMLMALPLLGLVSRYKAKVLV